MQNNLIMKKKQRPAMNRSLLRLGDVYVGVHIYSFHSCICNFPEFKQNP